MKVVLHYKNYDPFIYESSSIESEIFPSWINALSPGITKLACAILSENSNLYGIFSKEKINLSPPPFSGE